MEDGYTHIAHDDSNNSNKRTNMHGCESLYIYFLRVPLTVTDITSTNITEDS